MKETDLNNLLECAVCAVKAAGTHALANYSRRHEIAKASDDDIKLLLDIECQDKIFKIIQSAFPSHDILGEEGCLDATGNGFRWIVDPLDGTVNFSHGLPIWCSSVAVQLNGKTLAGAVYAPALNQCYTATNEAKSLCNGDPIHTSLVQNPEGAMVLTGFPKQMKYDKSAKMLFDDLLAHTQRTRIYGAAALDTCFVAAGSADAYIESGLYIWDIAAGMLIVKQAGGDAGIIKNMPNDRLTFLAANKTLFTQLKNFYKRNTAS
jgi:myo-inositol-1(or 4)-monophosphatase